jgi:hypothetical protein
MSNLSPKKYVAALTKLPLTLAKMPIVMMVAVFT